MFEIGDNLSGTIIFVSVVFAAAWAFKAWTDRKWK